MKIELRADNTAHISGYVNVAERESRPVITPVGKAVEVIEQRAFQQALDRADNVNMTVDHNQSKVIASTKAGSLKLYEDNIGLRAESEITDSETISAAINGKIKGWSFGMTNVVDTLEERADKLPLRRIKALELDHITLVINKRPCYSATSVELRANGDGEFDMEERCCDIDTTIENHRQQADYSAYEARINKVKGEKSC